LCYTKQILTSPANFGQCYDQLPCGIVVVSSVGLLTYANPAAVRMLHSSKRVLLNKPYMEALPWMEHSVLQTEDWHPVHQVLRGHRAWRCEVGTQPGFLRPDDTVLPVLLTISPMVVDGNTAALLAFHDASPERELDTLKSEFVALAAHQLRTPLSTVRWYSEMLHTAQDEANATPLETSYVHEIQRATVRMANLLDALMHVARLEGGRLKLQATTVDLGQTLFQMAEEWRHNALQQQLSFHLDVPEEPQFVCTDVTLLQVVLQNLVMNAFKYSAPKMEVCLSLRTEGKNIIFSVQDTGIGIPLGDQIQLFHRFFRARNARETVSEGSGLGLYMSRMIANSLGGYLYFHSAEGKGSTFVLVLPIGPCQLPVAAHTK
jgi:signal transduction histidine kinase